MSAKNSAVIREGDTLRVQFKARCLSSGHRVGKGTFSTYIQRTTSGWEGIGGSSGIVDGQWRTYVVVARATKNYDVGQVELAMHLGTVAQTLEFTQLSSANLGPNIDLKSLPFTRIHYGGQEPNAPWRAKAKRMIDQNRKANLQVRVLDARGRPVPAAAVQVRMLKHAYPFGVFCESTVLKQDADGEKYRTWTRRLFNKATAPWYWADWGYESERTQAEYFGISDWLQKERIPTRAHVLIYPGWQFMPAKAVALKNDPPALKRMMMDHLREKLERTRKYQFVGWDILNELRDLTELAQTFGGEQIYVDIFKAAHAVDPKPTFFLNENTIVESGGMTQTQQDEYERMLRSLIAKGAPIEGIGIQGHFGESVTDIEEVWRITDRFARFRLPLEITEFDINARDEQGQADYLLDFLTAWFAHPATHGFIQWGFWEGQHWLPQAALIRKDWTLKPNGRAYMDLVTKTWWTNADLKADRKGQARVRGFLGEYEVSATVGGKSIRRRVQLTRPGTTLTLQVAS